MCEVFHFEWPASEVGKTRRNAGVYSETIPSFLLQAIQLALTARAEDLGASRKLIVPGLSGQHGIWIGQSRPEPQPMLYPRHMRDCDILIFGSGRSMVLRSHKTICRAEVLLRSAGVCFRTMAQEKQHQLGNRYSCGV